MKVRFTPGAVGDLTDIGDALRRIDPTGAANVRSDIEAAVRTMGEHPFSGRRQDGDDVRKTVTRRYGYLIYYAVDDREAVVTVLAVRHQARERPYGDG